MASLYDKMLYLKPDEIFETYFSQYTYENGEASTVEMNSNIGYSDGVASFIDRHILLKKIPTEKDISALLVSNRHFMFAKSEKLCLGGLVLLYFWRESAAINNLSYNQANLSKVLCDFIILCSKMKFSKGDNFFVRLYDTFNSNELPEKNTFQDDVLSKENDKIELQSINTDEQLSEYRIDYYSAQINKILTTTETEIIASVHFTNGLYAGKMDIAFREKYHGHGGIFEGESVIIKVFSDRNSGLIVSELKKNILTGIEYKKENGFGLFRKH